MIDWGRKENVPGLLHRKLLTTAQGFLPHGLIGVPLESNQNGNGVEADWSRKGMSPSTMNLKTLILGEKEEFKDGEF